MILKYVENKVYKPTVIERTEKTYGYYFDENGVRCFGVIGERDVFAEIQRHKDSCDYSILKKFLFDNYEGAQPGVYGVTRSAVHNDIITAQEHADKMSAIYNALPVVIKNKYKNIYEVIKNCNAEEIAKLMPQDNNDNRVDNSVVKDSEVASNE